MPILHITITDDDIELGEAGDDCNCAAVLAILRSLLAAGYRGDCGVRLTASELAIYNSYGDCIAAIDPREIAGLAAFVNQFDAWAGYRERVAIGDDPGGSEPPRPEPFEFVISFDA